MDNSTTNANRYGFRTIVSVQLFHDVLDVNFYRLLRYEQSCCDIFVSITAGNSLKHLDLSTRQCLIAQVLSQL